MAELLPPNATWVSPYIIVADVDKAAEFYKNAFGMKVHEIMPGEDGISVHGELHYKNHLLMIGKQGAYGGKSLSPKTSGVESPMNLYIYCEDVDAFYKHALAHGAVSSTAPEDTFWGDRMCRIKDPDNYVWCFATHKTDCVNSK